MLSVTSELLTYQAVEMSGCLSDACLRPPPTSRRWSHAWRLPSLDDYGPVPSPPPQRRPEAALRRRRGDILLARDVAIRHPSADTRSAVRT
jgi:hypothetical protein